MVIQGLSISRARFLNWRWSPLPGAKLALQIGYLFGEAINLIDQPA
jgi:hypothetical protein